jgi:cytidylate kinase
MRAGFQNVITVDGASGAGKTVLLCGLRARFGCTALEAGPVLRTLAWLSQHQALTTPDAVAVMARTQALGRLRIDRPGAGELAASEVDLDGLLMRQSTFSGALLPALVAASQDTEVVSWMQTLVRETIRGRHAAISGRQAAESIGPSAGLRVRLQASPQIRAERKRTQMLSAGLRGPWQDDAVLLPLDPAVDLAIDTTRLSIEDVLHRVASLAEARLHWRPMTRPAVVLDEVLLLDLATLRWPQARAEFRAAVYRAATSVLEDGHPESTFTLPTRQLNSARHQQALSLAFALPRLLRGGRSGPREQLAGFGVGFQRSDQHREDGAE